MRAKINDGLTNTQRYRLRHPERVRAASLAWYYRNQEHSQDKSRAWLKSHPERVAELKRLWRDRNREKMRQINRDYYTRHRERKAAEKREWRKAHPKEAAEIKKRWMEKNPEKARESQVARRIRRRANEKAAEGGFSVHCIRFLFSRQCGLCYYCAESILGGYEIDHIIPLSKGGSNWRANLALACESCNRRKGDQTEGWSQHWVHYQH